LDYALERGALVRTIAKGFALGETAAAKADLGAPAETISVAFLVYNFYFTINQQRPVVHNRDFYICHAILRSKLVNLPLRCARIQSLWE
jgi:hypothetical protein